MPDVYAFSGTFVPSNGDSVARVLSRAVDAWVRGRGRDSTLPEITPESGWARRTPDGGVVRWEMYERNANSRGTDGARSLYELTWRHPHRFGDTPYRSTPESPDIFWSSRLSCVLQDDGKAVIAVRVSNTGPSASSREALRTTRPRLMRDLALAGTLSSDGVNWFSVPRVLGPVEVGDLARYDLLDPARRLPVALITTQQGHTLVKPEELALELLTLARVYVVEAGDATHALEAALGRRDLSVFGGGVRVYLPGLHRDSNPFDHPLLTAKRVTDRDQRQGVARYLSLRSVERFSDDPRIGALRDERAAAEDLERRRMAAALESAASTANDIADFQALAELYAADNVNLREQLDAMRTRLETAESRISVLDGERRQLLFHLRQKNESLSSEDASERPPLPEPETVEAAVDAAANLFGDHLHFLPRAWETAADSPFDRPADVLDAFRALAAVAARRTAAGSLGAPLRELLASDGLDYRPGISRTTSRRLRQQYEIPDEDGTTVFCPEHLVFGTSYDPRHCLRVYLASPSDDEPRFVIGHVGRHLDVETTT